MTPRRRVWRMLDPRARSGLSRTNMLLGGCILLASLVAILETEPDINRLAPPLFVGANLLFGVVFLVEYMLRLWAAPENPDYAGRFGRLRWMATPAAIIDLIAVSPLFLTFAGASLFWLRFARIIRVLRLARLGPLSSAIDLLFATLHERRYELGVAGIIALMTLLLSSTMLYLAEAGAQPETFGSIPRAMWWSVVTLTTVGYGDAYPVTVLGKVCAAFVAISGIGLIAMPTGILAAGFSDMFQRRKSRKRTGGPTLPDPPPAE